MLEITAPAKINLTLEILTRMADGFHKIRSVAQTINLCDTLRFRADSGTRIRCSIDGLYSGRSLIGKTVELFQDEFGISNVSIDVTKRIPLLSGLGGDSSDAAATLIGLNQLCALGLSPNELLSLAAQLGSDVPFFLCGGTALLESRGELVTTLPPFPHTWMVLVFPPVARTQGKTKRMYGNIGVKHYSRGSTTEKFVSCLGEDLDIPSSLLFNVFDDLAPKNFPGLELCREKFLNAGANEIHLAGSGPALFSLVKNRARGERIRRYLEKAGIHSCVTDTRSRSVDMMVK
jgi:4-diphosphocytidyl-2-C-methyl-D-erythritol kinase